MYELALKTYLNRLAKKKNILLIVLVQKYPTFTQINIYKTTSHVKAVSVTDKEWQALISDKALYEYYRSIIAEELGIL